jgi:hypothetical protein
LKDFPAPDMIHLSPKAFKKMKRLRMFINRNTRFSKVLNFLPNELKLFDWPEYPGESVPSNFCGENLLELNMCYSYLKELEGLQVELLFLIFFCFNYVVNFSQSSN